MAKRKYDPATQEEMVNFVEQLDEWCKHHPSNCYLSCGNISQCKCSPNCLTLEMNFSETTYSKLSNDLSGQPSAKTIRDYYRKWKVEKIAIKKTSVAVKLFSFLENFKTAPNSDDKVLENFKAELKEYYNAFDLKKGCELAETAIKQYPYNIDIIRWWALLNNRKMNWRYVKDVLTKKIEATRINEVKAECYLAIFEACMNEYIRDRHKLKAYEKFEEAKIKFLDAVPNKELNGKYYYFHARFLEAEWLNLPNNAKEGSNTIIRHALANVNKSIDLYKNDDSGYSAIDLKPWWLYCHKVILLKLWSHDEYLENLKKYGELILEEITINPNRKSTQMYAITYYILGDKMESLNSFLVKLDGMLIADRRLSNTSKEENKIVAMDNNIYQFIELLFYNDIKKVKEYHKVITLWFQRNIH